MNIITEEQLWVLKLINSTRDDVLKNKLLELDDPTEERIMAKVRSYGNATFNQSSLAGTKRALKSNQPTKFTGECGSCKLVGHKSNECKGRISGRLKCKKCSEMNRPAKGHLAGAFLCPLRRRDRERSQSNDKTKPAKRNDRKSNKTANKKDEGSSSESSPPPEGDRQASPV